MPTLPEIKINIVAGGHDQVLAILKTIEQATIQHEKSSVNILKQSLASKESLYKEHAGKINKILDSIHGSNGGGAGGAQLAGAKQTTDQLLREYTRRNHMLIPLMRSMGMHGAANFTRFTAQLTGGMVDKGMMSSEAANGLTGGAALVGGAATAAAFVVKKAFSVLSDGVSFAAHEFSAAILELGGGFSVHGAIVSAGKVQRGIAQIRAASLPENRMAAGEMNSAINSMSEGTEFRREDILKAARIWTSKTGDTKSFFKLGNDFTKIATTSEMPLDELSSMMANIKTQFAELSNQEQMDLLLRTKSMGMRGTVELKDLGKLSKVTGFASMMSGNRTENIARLASYTEMAAPGFGNNVNNAVTGVGALETVFRKMRPEDQKRFGANWKDVGGQKLLTNMDDVLQNMIVSSAKEGPGFKMKGIGSDKKFTETLAAFKTGAGVQEGDTSEIIREKVKKMFEAFRPDPQTMDDVNRTFKEISETADYKLKAAFNDLTTKVGTALLPAIEKLVPQIISFIESIDSESIKTAGDILVGIFGAVIDSASDLAQVFLTFGVVVADLASLMLTLIRYSPIQPTDAQGNSLDYDKIQGLIDKSISGMDDIGKVLDKGKENKGYSDSMKGSSALNWTYTPPSADLAKKGDEVLAIIGASLKSAGDNQLKAAQMQLDAAAKLASGDGTGKPMGGSNAAPPQPSSAPISPERHSGGIFRGSI